MTVPALRIVAWSAALLGIGVLIAFVRTQSNVAPNISPAIEERDVSSDADARPALRDDGTPVLVGYVARPPEKTNE